MALKWVGQLQNCPDSFITVWTVLKWVGSFRIVLSKVKESIDLICLFKEAKVKVLVESRTLAKLRRVGFTCIYTCIHVYLYSAPNM